MSELEQRALREAREVCVGEHTSTPQMAWAHLTPAECACCRRIAAALLRAEARGLRDPDNRRQYVLLGPFALAAQANELEAAAARLRGEGG